MKARVHWVVWVVVLTSLAAVASDLATGGLVTLPKELRESAYFNRNRRPAARALAAKPAPNAEPAGYSASLEDAVVAGVVALQETIDVSSFKLPYGTDAEKAQTRALLGYICDLNGECFNVSVTQRFLFGSRNGLLTTVKPIYYTADAEVFASQLAEFRAETAKAMAVVEEGMDDVAKALALHDYIVTHCDYGRAGVDGPDQTAYGALVNHSAVCAGYSRAYCHLLKLAGIRSDFVRAGAIDHAWNLVDIDGKSYHVDCTWDDPVVNNATPPASHVLHNNFLLDDAGIRATSPNPHTTWDDPSLTGTSDRFNGYFWQNALGTPLPWVGGKVYALKADGTEAVLHACDTASGEAAEVWRLSGSWEGSYVSGGLPFGLAKWRGLLWLSNHESVWWWDRGTEGAEPQEITGDAVRCDYSATGENAEITGLLAEGASLYAINQKVETAWHELKQVPWTPVTAMALDVSSQAVSYDGEHESTFTLSATVEPADATYAAFRWSSSDEAVATVEAAGVVTVHGPGTATITATSCDGGVTATCALTVSRVYQQTISLKAGWNLVGVSLVPDAGSLAALTAYPLFVRDGQRGVFVRLRGTPEPGIAYWLYATSPAELTLKGTAPSASSITLTPGWNAVTPLQSMADDFPWTGAWRWTGRFFAPQQAAPVPGDALWLNNPTNTARSIP